MWTHDAFGALWAEGTNGTGLSTNYVTSPVVQQGLVAGQGYIAVKSRGSCVCTSSGAFRTNLHNIPNKGQVCDMLARERATDSVNISGS